MEFFETIGQFFWVILQAILVIGLIGFVMFMGGDDEEEEEEAAPGGTVFDLPPHDPNDPRDVPVGETWRHGTGYTDGHGYYPTKIG